MAMRSPSVDSQRCSHRRHARWATVNYSVARTVLKKTGGKFPIQFPRHNAVWSEHMQWLEIFRNASPFLLMALTGFRVGCGLYRSERNFLLCLFQAARWETLMATLAGLIGRNRLQNANQRWALI